ncbi:MAG: glycosyltransferase family 39 protein [bacterium]|nr:glycosyltransferase family 39 protein [bacterium]
MKFFKNSRLLIVILALGALLRLWGLSNTPPHLTNDEAALGYNAYSILKTARDEHGEFLPVIFKSFGDWKPGLYIYLDVPFIATLGLNEFATRLPSALAGILAIWLLYLIVLKLFNKPRLAILTSFFLAISPWHLQFSRGAWEANIALTLTLAGIYFFLTAVNGVSRQLVYSAIFFALTLWTYQGAKLASAIIILGLVVAFFRDFIKIPRNIIINSVVLGVLISVPVLISLLQGKTGRLEVYSAFSYERPPEAIQEILKPDKVGVDSWQYVLFHSERLNFTRGILSRWFNHYSGRFLFFEGDWQNPRNGVPNAGVILLLDSIFLLAGLVALARLGKNNAAIFLWLWFILASLPAALSRDQVQAVRSFNMVIPLTIILALGVDYWWGKRERFGRILIFVVPIFILSYLANYFYYLDQYWVHAPTKNSQYWQYGYKQMVEKVVPLENKYREIIIKQDYAQPYIFFLFYQKYDPEKYQKVSEEVFVPNQYGDVGLISRLDNIVFREINWSADQGMSGKLFIVDPIKVPVKDSSDPKEFKLTDEIKFLNGESAFRFLEIL